MKKIILLALIAASFTAHAKNPKHEKNTICATSYTNIAIAIVKSNQCVGWAQRNNVNVLIDDIADTIEENKCMKISSDQLDEMQLAAFGWLMAQESKNPGSFCE